MHVLQACMRTAFVNNVLGDNLLVSHARTAGLRKNWDVPETFPNTAVIKAYKDAKVDQNKDKFTYGRPDLQLLRRFCLDKFGWQQDRADELLVPVLKVPCSALPCFASRSKPCLLSCACTRSH